MTCQVTKTEFMVFINQSQTRTIIRSVTYNTFIIQVTGQTDVGLDSSFVRGCRKTKPFFYCCMDLVPT